MPVETRHGKCDYSFRLFVKFNSFMTEAVKVWNIFKVKNTDILLFIANYEHISHLALVFLLLTLRK